MLPLKFYLDPFRYAELERLAREAATTISQLIKRLVEDWLEDKLCENRRLVLSVSEAKIQQLERRFGLLEEIS